MHLTRHALSAAAAALALSLGAGAAHADTTVLSEGFDNGLTGWTVVNLSTAGGTTSWFQGDVSIFTAQAGADESYAAANFNNAPAGGTIADWLYSPVLSLNPLGSTLSFYTRAAADAGFSDNLNVVFIDQSTPGNTTFTQLITVTNVGGNWTQYTVSFGAGATTGQLAFVYNQQADLANYLGVDTVTVTTAAVPEPTTYGMMGLALALGAGVSWRRRRAAGR